MQLDEGTQAAIQKAMDTYENPDQLREALKTAGIDVQVVEAPVTPQVQIEKLDESVFSQGETPPFSPCVGDTVLYRLMDSEIRGEWQFADQAKEARNVFVARPAVVTGICAGDGRLVNLHVFMDAPCFVYVTRVPYSGKIEPRTWIFSDMDDTADTIWDAGAD